MQHAFCRLTAAAAGRSVHPALRTCGRGAALPGCPSLARHGDAAGSVNGRDSGKTNDGLYGRPPLSHWLRGSEESFMARVKRQVEKSQYSISLISLNHQSGAISTLCPEPRSLSSPVLPPAPCFIPSYRMHLWARVCVLRHGFGHQQ